MASRRAPALVGFSRTHSRTAKHSLASSAVEDAKSAWASWARRASGELRPEAVDFSLSRIPNGIGLIRASVGVAVVLFLVKGEPPMASLLEVVVQVSGREAILRISWLRPIKVLNYLNIQNSTETSQKP